jgi:Zn-dependent protease
MTKFERVILFPLMVVAIYLNFRGKINLNADWIIELISGTLFALLCISFNRFTQSFFANRAGDINQRLEGYLTLNPFKFVDWLGLLPFIFFHFGWAKQIKSDYVLKGKIISQRLFLSIIGVLINLILAIIIALLIGPSEGISLTLAAVLRLFAKVNIFYAVFSLLPIPPLNGWLIISSILRKNANIDRYEFYGELLIIVLIGSKILPAIISYIGNYILSIFYI